MTEKIFGYLILLCFMGAAVGAVLMISAFGWAYWIGLTTMWPTLSALQQTALVGFTLALGSGVVLAFVVVMMRW
jgi:hypothetical protein